MFQPALPQSEKKELQLQRGLAKVSHHSFCVRSTNKPRLSLRCFFKVRYLSLQTAVEHFQGGNAL